MKVFGLVVTWLMAVSVSSVLAQASALVEGGKKEGGKVIVYGYLEADTGLVLDGRALIETHCATCTARSIG